jgi:tRNA pseudouridine55 synthase
MAGDGMDLNGFLNINKPSGWTSHDVVAKIRNLLGVQKVGHAGTLDPAATGVLPVCIGKATKVAQFLLETDKQYRLVMRLGETTDTLDATGTILERKPAVSVGHDLIRKAVEGFRGSQMQTVPMFSAVKVGGRPLYKSARQNLQVERPSRRILIYAIQVTGIRDRPEAGVIDVEMDVACSKGTYIRVLCADIGEKLGTGAHLFRLERRASGPFEIGDSIDLEEVARRTADGSIGEVLTSISKALSGYSSLRVNPKASGRVIHGGGISGEELTDAPTKFKTGETVLVYNSGNELVALASALMSRDGPAEGPPAGLVFKIDKVLV